MADRLSYDLSTLYVFSPELDTGSGKEVELIAGKNHVSLL